MNIKDPLNIPAHPYADIFPMMSKEEIDALSDDIDQNGMVNPIVIYQDMILDGRNRYQACLQRGLSLNVIEYEGDDPLGYVISQNLARRHLTTSQRAMVAASLANLVHGGDRQGANLHLGLPISAAAEALSVSQRSVKTAAKVKKKGVPELGKAVTEGRISVDAAADIADAPEAQQREIAGMSEGEILKAAKEIRAKKAEKQREERIQKIEEIAAKSTPLQTDRRYALVYADPPWAFENPPMGETDRSITNHYPTMSLDEICALPVRDIAADDAILYLWATAPKLAECMKVLEAWGFEYRTCFVWVKDKIGMGYHARNQHELLLVAKRGDIPPPDPQCRFSSVVHAPRGAHSEKPHEFYELIETMYPELGKIELFARNKREGWQSWGNQA